MSSNHTPPRCPLCEREAPLVFRTRDVNRCLSQELFSYYRCRVCRLIFLSPVPPDLGSYYPQNYYAIPSSKEELGDLVKAQHFKIEMVQKFVKSGKLLEIGPACGDFVYHAQKAGFEIDTIEMDERCCEFLRDVVGVNAVQSADTVAALAQEAPDVSYDVIALWQVIEHLPDYWKSIEAAAGRLAEGGIMVLAAPNPSAFQFRVLKKHWTHVDAPRHVCLIPIPLLIKQARQWGLEPVLVTTSDPGSIEWNSFGWRFSLMNWSRYGKVKAVLYRIGSGLTWLSRGIERSSLRGSTYTLVFKKVRSQ